MTIGVLAVQGAFIEHEKMLSRLGVDSFEIRQKKDLEASMDGLILPGGESTVMGKLITELGIKDILKKKINDGMPVLGTCAGLILLADQIEGEDSVHLATMPVKVRRNAYGRQLGSFCANTEMKGIGQIPMTFIRAPYIEKCGEGVEILAMQDDKIVAARYGKQLGIAFHPEVTQDVRMHKYFLDMIDHSESQQIIS